MSAKTNGRNPSSNNQFAKCLKNMHPGPHTISIPITLSAVDWVLLQSQAITERSSIDEVASRILADSDAGM